MGALQRSLTGVTSGLRHPISYDQFVSRLDSVHGISDDREDALIKLSNCGNGQDEPMPMYGEKIRQLIERAYPSYSPGDKHEQVIRVLNGLPSRNDIRLQMKMRDFRSLREARLEQVIISERESENQRGVNVRAVTHDEAFPEGDILSHRKT